MRTRLAILALAAGVSLGGCAYGGLGMGTGYGPYGSYGYDPYYGGGSGISYGIRYGNAGYGYSPYGYSPYGYSPYGGYGMPYYGWNNGYYYPGTGYYVYDQYRRPRVWSDAEKAYWTERLRQSQASNGVTKVPNNRQMRAVWDDFRRQRNSDNVFVPTTTTSSQRAVRSQNVSDNRSARVERQNQSRADRSERRAERRADRASIRSTRSEERSTRRARQD